MLFDANHTYTSEQITTFTGLWTEIIKHLSLHHDPKIICSFLNKCAIVSIDEKHKKLDIGVPNEFILSQAKKFFQKTLKEAIHSVYNQQYSYDLHIFIPFQNKVAHPLHIDLKKILKVTGTIEPPTVAKENGLDLIVLAIRKNQLPKLLTEFRQIDVLLLDDVQFLGDKEKTQEIFHNIFNEMHSAGKQIVITSDRAPRELNNIDARLKSRFGL